MIRSTSVFRLTARIRQKPVLRLRHGQWTTLVAELGRRGDGRREAGAFLLASPRRNTRVRRVVFFDDVDPDCLRGHIEIGAEAFQRLWEICERERLVVVGDVHTHEGCYVGQSHIDADNPMVAQCGHVALIVPNLARGDVLAHEVGVHRYDGESGWTSWFGDDAQAKLRLGWWS
jgi:proteasome lid subunit RPN8/RPN11